jgi:hypothetical protein
MSGLGVQTQTPLQEGRRWRVAKPSPETVAADRLAISYTYSVSRQAQLPPPGSRHPSEPRKVMAAVRLTLRKHGWSYTTAGNFPVVSRLPTPLSPLTGRGIAAARQTDEQGAFPAGGRVTHETSTADIAGKTLSACHPLGGGGSAEAELWGINKWN